GEIYHHTQRGTGVVAGICAAIALVGWARWDHPREGAVLAGALALGALTLLLFATLTVRVTEDAIAIAFGLGIVRKRFALADVQDARAVRNRWWYGWGIRRIPGGWLYNVAGLDAVELRLASGRTVRIGTDEPERLLAAIRQARARLPGRGAP